MTIKQIVIAAILGATLGAAAATVHADSGKFELAEVKGVFTCDAQIWPADKWAFVGAPESSTIRRYEVDVSNMWITFRAAGGQHEVRLITQSLEAKGSYGTETEGAYVMRGSEDKRVYFSYRNHDSGDSVGFFNCVAKRKF